MAVQVNPITPSLPATTAIQDPAVRRFAQAVEDALRALRSEEGAVESLKKAADAMNNAVAGGTPPSIAQWLFSSELYQKLTSEIARVDTQAKQDVLDEALARSQAIQEIQAALAEIESTPAYDPATTYQIGDLVTYDNKLYRAKAETTGNLPTNTTYWDKVGDYATLGDVVAAHTLQLSEIESDITDIGGDLAAEITARDTLATQLRGTYTGTDVAMVSQGLLYSERQARVAADGVTVSNLNALRAQVGVTEAGTLTEGFILNEQTIRNTNDLAIVSAVNTALAQITGVSTSISQSGENLIANWTQAQATKWSQIESEVLTAGGQTIRAALAQESNTRATLEGQVSSTWMVRAQIDSGTGKPYVAGIALGAEGQNGGATSEFIVQADKFVFTMPGYGNYVPFAIGPSGAEFTGLTSWGNVTGDGRPEDGATAGASFGGVSYSYTPVYSEDFSNISQIAANLAGHIGRFDRVGYALPTGWGLYNGGGISVTTSVVAVTDVFLSNAVRITANASTTQTLGVYCRYNVTGAGVTSWTPGVVHTISFKARAVSANALGKQMYGLYTNMGFDSRQELENPGLTYGWQQYSFSGAPLSNAHTGEGELYLSWKLDGTLLAGASFEIADVRVEVGSGAPEAGKWRNYNGLGEVSAATGTQYLGGKALVVGNNSGNDQAWLIGPTNIQYDPDKLYRVRARLRGAKGSGSAYVGFAGVGANGVQGINIIGENVLGSQNYGVLTGSSLNSNLTEYQGYFSGTSALVPSGPNPSPETPMPMYTGVQYVRPLILVNYNNEPGQVEIDYFIVEEVTSTPVSPNISGQITPSNVSTYIANAAIGNAQIGNAAVNTLQVAGNAITAPVAGAQADYYWTAKTSTRTDTRIIGSITTSLHGRGQVMIQIMPVGATILAAVANFGGTGTPISRIRLLRNGVEIYKKEGSNVTVGGSMSGTTPTSSTTCELPGILYLDSPGVGVTCTYALELYFYSGGGDVNVSHRINPLTFFIMEYRK